jgi:PEP-CTERM motif
MFKQSVIRTLTSALVATCLSVAASAASASTTSAVTLSPNILFLLGVGGVSVVNSGTVGTYTQTGALGAQTGTFAAPIASLSVTPSDTVLTWSSAAKLDFFNAAQNATLTFSGLVFDSASSVIKADLHFVNGVTSAVFDFPGSVVFSVGAFDASPATLLNGGTVTAAISLSKSGLSNAVAQLGTTFPGATDILAGTVSFTSTAPTTVPEPTTTLSFLVGAGLMGTMLARRRAAK